MAHLSMIRPAASVRGTSVNAPQRSANIQRLVQGRSKSQFARSSRTVCAVAMAPAREFLTMNESSVSILVVDSTTATVTIRSPDRPGLLQDVSDAINTVGLSVESADITTPLDAFAVNNFTVKVADGMPDGMNFETVKEEAFSEYDDEEVHLDSILAGKLKDAILTQTLARSRQALAERAAKGPTEEDIPTVVAPSANVSLLLTPKEEVAGIVVEVEATDFSGILASITAGFESLGLTIRSARVNTVEGVIKNRFVLNYDAGKADLEAIKAATLKAVTGQN